jgi:hypothetical protein
MSCHYLVCCRDCPATDEDFHRHDGMVATDWWSHADDDVRLAHDSLPLLVALHETGAWDSFCDLRTRGTYDCRGLASFLIRHAEHRLALVSECGEEEVLQDLRCPQRVGAIPYWYEPDDRAGRVGPDGAPLCRECGREKREHALRSARVKRAGS